VYRKFVSASRYSDHELLQPTRLTKRATVCARQIDVGSFVKVQKTVKSRGDVMEDGAIVLPDVFTASAAFS